VTEDLNRLFHEYFEIHYDVSQDPALLHEALRLRYQVYCLEHSYEDPGAFTDEMERDVFDGRAMHTLLVHRASGLIAGTVRVIFTDPAERLGSLPIDNLCKEELLFDESVMPRQTLAEISRFAISKDFRRRVEDAQTPTGIGEQWSERQAVEQRRIPHLSLGLMQALACNSAREGITHWVAEMEPALLRMLRKLGVHWIKLGPMIQFHGKRQPCYVDLDQMYDRMLDEREDIWNVFTNGGKCLSPGATRPT
jgi:N-acyl amino acid synthase of PEP-CTERM/exosortase system